MRQSGELATNSRKRFSAASSCANELRVERSTARAHTAQHITQAEQIIGARDFTGREYSTVGRSLALPFQQRRLSTSYLLYSVQAPLTPDRSARRVAARRSSNHCTAALLEHWRRSCDLAVRTRTRTSKEHARARREEHMRLRVQCEQSSRTTELYCSVVSCHVM